MANNILLPSLSETGWITSSEQIADYLFAHFFESDYSQTQIYLGNVSSFAWILNKEQDNISEMVILLRNTLQNYYGRFFTDVVVEVDDVTDPTNQSKIILNIFISFKDSDGITYTLSKVINDAGSKSIKVITLNNTGAER